MPLAHDVMIDSYRDRARESSDVFELHGPLGCGILNFFSLHLRLVGLRGIGPSGHGA